MSATDIPGLAPYSKDWASAACQSVQEPLVPVVVAISESFQLDGRAPDSLAHLIEHSLRDELAFSHILRDGTEIRPLFVTFDGHRWGWAGLDKTDHVRHYASDEIEQRVR